MLHSIPVSELRRRLKHYCDEICESSQPMLAIRQNGKNVVLISEDDFRSLNETVYLLSTRKNRERLKSAMSKKGEVYDSVDELGETFGLQD